MFEYIKGKLVESHPGRAIVDVGGLGYSLLVPLNNYPNFPQIGTSILLYSALVIREDAHTLFGFLTRHERDLFYRLIDVSGIGPKTALALIGHLDPVDLHMAISQGNVALLCKAPGIGKKTAERLIVDLRDTLKKEPHLERGSNGGVSADAVSALVNLGYHPLQAQKAISKVMQEAKQEWELPHLITAALKVL